MNRPWQNFYNEKLKKVFSEKRSVLDIGGGLRLIREKGNRYNPDLRWLKPYLEKVDYKIMDPVSTYEPDIVGDIHNIPFEDNSVESILCIAVLEHVENPIKACEEMYRVLKPDSYCVVYVPFLYYYHAEKGYYGDYWRFTKDTINVLFKKFKTIEIEPVRGALETWLWLSPLGRNKILSSIFHFLDRLTGKIKSNQVSGYYVFLVK